MFGECLTSPIGPRKRFLCSLDIDPLNYSFLEFSERQIVGKQPTHNWRVQNQCSTRGPKNLTLTHTLRCHSKFPSKKSRLSRKKGSIPGAYNSYSHFIPPESYLEFVLIHVIIDCYENVNFAFFSIFVGIFKT